MTNLQHSRYLLISVIFLIILTISGCQEEAENGNETVAAADRTALPTNVVSTPTLEPTAPPPGTGGLLSGVAGVEEVDVAVIGEPPQVQIIASGNLENGCVQVDEVITERQEDTLLVTITTEEEAGTDCADDPVSFEETITFDVQELEPGTYLVEVNGVRASFEVLAPAEETETPGTQGTAMPTPTVSITPHSAAPGSVIHLTAIGLMANEQVQIGTGPVNSEYDIITSAMTDAQGRLNVEVQLPTYASADENWVFVVEVDDDKLISEPIQVTGAGADPGTGNGTRTNIYLIAPEDEGASGEAVGCGDSVVAVEVEIGETIAPLRATLEQLLAIESEYYGESGLYNALYRSDLQIQGINIQQRTAIIHLTGNLRLGGVCDSPRVEAQLEKTALQFATVDDVEILVNGTRLEELLDEQ